MMEKNRRCADQAPPHPSECSSRPVEGCLGSHRQIGQCPLCGDMILVGWEKCRRCGEPLTGSSQKTERLAHPYRLLNRKGIHHLAGQYQLRSGAIRQCSLCGDMVSVEWEKCPRCQEPVANSLLP